MYEAWQETAGHADNVAVKTAQKKDNQKRLNKVFV